MTFKNLFKGDSRSVLIKKNILGSLAIKGWSSIIQFMIVPLSLICLTKYEYGLWLTINSILVGIDAIDVGLGNGLRNKLAEAMAIGDKVRARQLVTTTFAMLICVIVPVILIIGALIITVDCHAVLNVDPELVPNFKEILLYAFCIMGCTFIFKFIGNMFLGLQLPAINNLLVVLGQTLSLFVLFIISQRGKSDLSTVVITFTASPLVVYLLAYPICFLGKYKFLAPSPKLVDGGAFCELLSLGSSFFFIQITGLALFMSSNVIITKLISPEAVTPYQVAHRYFSILFILFSIIVSPLWSATTDAYTKGDWAWIDKMMRRIHQLLLVCVVIDVLMFLIAPVFYDIWLHGKVEVPALLNALLATYIFVNACSNAYSYILLGIGKVRLITWVTAIQALVFIPFEYFACQRYGINGVVVVLIIATTVSAVVNYIQFYKISHNTATGLWNK